MPSGHKRTGRFCCDCPEFPCDRLKHLNRRYRTNYGMSQIENLEFIRNNGIQTFVAAELRKWISENGVYASTTSSSTGNNLFA